MMKGCESQLPAPHPTAVTVTDSIAPDVGRSVKAYRSPFPAVVVDTYDVAPSWVASSTQSQFAAQLPDRLHSVDEPAPLGLSTYVPLSRPSRFPRASYVYPRNPKPVHAVAVASRSKASYV